MNLFLLFVSHFVYHFGTLIVSANHWPLDTNELACKVYSANVGNGTEPWQLVGGCIEKDWQMLWNHQCVKPVWFGSTKLFAFCTTLRGASGESKLPVEVSLSGTNIRKIVSLDATNEAGNFFKAIWRSPHCTACGQWWENVTCSIILNLTPQPPIFHLISSTCKQAWYEFERALKGWFYRAALKAVSLIISLADSL